MNKLPRLALNALGLTLSLSGSAFAQLAAVDRQSRQRLRPGLIDQWPDW